MQCKKVIHLFSAYLDGELMIEEEDRIEQHLNGCPQCHAEFVKLRNMVNLMGQLPQDDPGEAFSQSVMRRIRTAGDAAPLKESLPWGDRLAQWFRFEKAPRPIFGMAATLVLGLVVGAGIYQVLGGHLTGESDSTPGGVIARSEAPTLAVDGDRETPVV
ncbi:MAG: zf-HC2 domain-containing protein, partial [Candidatus Eisenbacteria bacterium]|nr:zf-HC2 domain-containing protein [Candidatus Eisenbacteria bacterium]